MLARDLEGTTWWVMERVGARYFGPLTPGLLELWQDHPFVWTPWDAEMAEA